jgi:hypothetical protein
VEELLVPLLEEQVGRSIARMEYWQYTCEPCAQSLSEKWCAEASTLYLIDAKFPEDQKYITKCFFMVCIVLFEQWYSVKEYRI